MNIEICVALNFFRILLNNLTTRTQITKQTKTQCTIICNKTKTIYVQYN